MKSFMMCIMDMSHAHARDSGVSNPWGQQGLSHPSRNVVSVCGWPQLLCLSAIRLISCRSKQSFPKCPGCGNRTHLTGTHGAPWDTGLRISSRMQLLTPMVSWDSVSSRGEWRWGSDILGRTSIMLCLSLVCSAAAPGTCKLLLQSMSPAIFSFHSEGDKS